MDAMSPRFLAFALAAIMVAPAVAVADIIRCVERDGRVTYQDGPCFDGSVPERTSIPSEYPAPNTIERERLLEREAALDRRLEARRDRELQEAQMREARAERAAERERLAMLAAAQAAQPQYFVAYPLLVRHWAPGQRRGSGARGDDRAPGTGRAQPIFR
jgi:hypothetical protein